MVLNVPLPNFLITVILTACCAGSVYAAEFKTCTVDSVESNQIILLCRDAEVERDNRVKVRKSEQDGKAEKCIVKTIAGDKLGLTCKEESTLQHGDNVKVRDVTRRKEC